MVAGQCNGDAASDRGNHAATLLLVVLERSTRDSACECRVLFGAASPCPAALFCLPTLLGHSASCQLPASLCPDSATLLLQSGLGALLCHQGNPPPAQCLGCSLQQMTVHESLRDCERGKPGDRQLLFQATQQGVHVPGPTGDDNPPWSILCRKPDIPVTLTLHLVPREWHEDSLGIPGGNAEVFPDSLLPRLHQAHCLHEAEVARGCGCSELPQAVTNHSRGVQPMRGPSSKQPHLEGKDGRLRVRSLGEGPACQGLGCSLLRGSLTEPQLRKGPGGGLFRGPLGNGLLRGPLTEQQLGVGPCRHRPLPAQRLRALEHRVAEGRLGHAELEGGVWGRHLPLPRKEEARMRPAPAQRGQATCLPRRALQHAVGTHATEAEAAHAGRERPVPGSVLRGHLQHVRVAPAPRQ
mmetsp:Transcript_42741/g.133394  ORF Transcript_42741/g.133394 Transcript_42741/m.133394 type:complete len:410 (-) Transcript_42741:178-1407(-)